MRTKGLSSIGARAIDGVAVLRCGRLLQAPSVITRASNASQPAPDTRCWRRPVSARVGCQVAALGIEFMVGSLGSLGDGC